MLGYIRARLLAALPVVFGVSVLVFLMLHVIPGDPVRALVGDAPLDQAQLDELRQELGFNDPLPVQYVRFLANAVRGDLGRSSRTGRPVVTEIFGQLPSTIELAFAAMCLAVVAGVGLGAFAAVRHRSWLDHSTMIIAIAGVSVPSFWLGSLFILLFSLALGWLPPSGTEGIQRLIMPAAVLGLGATAIIARLMRSGMLEVLQQEYVTTARAKGLSEWIVVYRHAVKNALIPVITIVGIQLGQLLAGAVVVESVFARKGVGQLLIDSLLSKDFPLVQGLMLVIATSYVIVNLIVDLAYALLDPRIRYR